MKEKKKKKSCQCFFSKSKKSKKSILKLIQLNIKTNQDNKWLEVTM